MVVENHSVHKKVKHDKVVYGCWNAKRDRRSYRLPVRLYDAEGNYVGMGVDEIENSMSVLCRNTGEYSKDRDGKYTWKEDKNCEGCNPLNKDNSYIARMRSLVEEEVRSLRLHV